MNRSSIAGFFVATTVFAGIGATSAIGDVLTLKSVGGATEGSITTVEVSGTPGDSYLVVLSLSGGPTVLPPPHTPSSIDVGFDLIDLSLAIPGFLGTIPAGGKVVIPLPFPYDPILQVLTLHLQALRIVNNVHFGGKSNPWIWTPSMPQTTRAVASTMNVARAGQAVVAMPDNSLLVFGGGADGVAASYGQRSIDRYDPATQTFTHLGDMLQPRVSHTATRLANGKILLAGGADDGVGDPTAFAELYDPATHTSVALPNMSTPRALHTANLLPDGRVWITGGTNSFANALATLLGALKSTTIFNPATNTWTAGPDMAEPRIGHTATTLANNKILLTGGYTLGLFGIPAISDKFQLYTPNAGIGTLTANATMSTGDRFGHAAIRLDNGNVWLIGGAQGTALTPTATNSIAEYDVGTNSFQIVTTMSVARALTTVVRTNDGLVAIAGGAYGILTSPTPDATIDILDQNGTFYGSIAMIRPRANFSANLLCDGTVLLMGGGEYPDAVNPQIVYSWDDAEILHL